MAITFTFGEAFSRGRERARLYAQEAMRAKQEEARLGETTRHNKAVEQDSSERTDIARSSYELQERDSLNQLIENEASRHQWQQEFALKTRATESGIRADESAIRRNNAQVKQAEKGEEHISLPTAVTEMLGMDPGSTIHPALANTLTTVIQMKGGIERAKIERDTELQRGKTFNVYEGLTPEQLGEMQTKLSTLMKDLGNGNGRVKGSDLTDVADVYKEIAKANLAARGQEATSDAMIDTILDDIRRRVSAGELSEEEFERLMPAIADSLNIDLSRPDSLGTLLDKNAPR